MKKVAAIFKIILVGLLVFVAVIFIAFGYKDKTVKELTANYAPPPSAFIAVDGMEVHYRDEGNQADSVPLVLIHGTGSSLHTFDAWAAGLKKEKRVVRMDIPAFGLTGPFPNRQYSIQHYVDFMNHFLSALGIQKCIIGGNSLGGEIAWNYTVQFPGMVKKLLLIDAAGYPLESKSVPIGFKIARMSVINRLLTFITPRLMVKMSVENVYADKSKVTDALVDRYFDLTLREGNRQALIDRLNIPTDTSAIPLIRNIQQPVLIMWGNQDLLIPVKYAYRFHNDLRDDTLIILNNTGHVPMEENPQESLAALLAFLKK